MGLLLSANVSRRHACPGKARYLTIASAIGASIHLYFADIFLKCRR